MLGGAGNSTMDSINESSTIMQQLNSSISNVFYQQSLSLRPGVSIEVKPGMLNFGRLCIGQTYQKNKMNDQKIVKKKINQKLVNILKIQIVHQRLIRGN